MFIHFCYGLKPRVVAHPWRYLGGDGWATVGRARCEGGGDGDAAGVKRLIAINLEGVDRAYVSRMVNLTTLAPDIVAGILEESLPDHVTLFDLASGTPLPWDEQRALLHL